MPRCTEAAAITAVQRLRAEKEPIRQSLRYEQQVICAKRYANFGHVFQRLYCWLFQPLLKSEQTSTVPNKLKEPQKRSLKELADSSKATPKKNTAKSNAPPNKNKGSEYSGVLAKLETSLEDSLKRSLSDLRQVVELLGNCSPSVSVRTNKWNKFVEKKEPRPVSSVTKRRQNESQVTERRKDELQASLDDFDVWTVTSGDPSGVQQRRSSTNESSNVARPKPSRQRAGQAVQRRRATARFFEVLNSIQGRACRGTSEEKTECPTRDMWGQSVVNSREDQGILFLD